uniref:Uncharacterized oxidoreductase dhs-27 n=1 Tax=Culex pipiens TaxID=7175 RepID=A0A8D8ACI7_CULPI
MSDQKKQQHQPEYVQVGLEQIATEQGFTATRYRIEYDESGSSNKGDGFVGTLFKAYIREDGRDELKLVVKVLPEHELRRQQSIGMFHREAMVYNAVMPLFGKFQTEQGLEKEEGFWRIPKCYYASCDLEKMEAVVIMEDLQLKGFRMWNKSKPADLEHSLLLMKQLGAFHAVSFAMKDQQPEQFGPFKHLVDPMKVMIDMDPKKQIHALFGQMYDRAATTLEEDDTEAKKAFEKLKGTVVDSYVECVSAEEAEPYAVIGHGDCWINNMMYTYEDKDPNPKDIRLIDWQLSRYVSPILDLSYFIFICTDEEFRANHFDQLLDCYYESLSDQLKKLGGNVESQFPRATFQDHWKRFGRFGLLMGLIVLPIVCTAKEELPEMEDYIDRAEQQQDAEFNFGTSEQAQEMYRTRMAGMIRDVVRLGYL